MCHSAFRLGYRQARKSAGMMGEFWRIARRTLLERSCQGFGFEYFAANRLVLRLTV